MAVRSRVDSMLRIICLVLFCLLMGKILYLHLGDVFPKSDTIVEEKTTEDPFDTAYSKQELALKQLFRDRRQRIKSVCESHFSSDFPLSWEKFQMNRLQPSDGIPQWWERLFVVPKTKMFFCSIPQVDSVDWVRHITHLGLHVTDKPAPQKLRPPALPQDYNWLNFSSSFIVPLAAYEPDQAKAILKDYKRVIWVRDPLERLVLAWQDKLQNWEYFSKERAYNLIKAVQENATMEEVEGIMPMPLDAFFAFLTNQPTSWGFDVNWRPYRDLCSICQLSYDYILYRETPSTMETLPYEVNYVFKQALERTDLPKFTVTPPEAVYNNSMLGEIPSTLIHRVLDIYKLDYALFGFQRPEPYQNFF